MLCILLKKFCEYGPWSLFVLLNLSCSVYFTGDHWCNPEEQLAYKALEHFVVANLGLIEQFPKKHLISNN
jgi:hypothetical protein